MWNWNNCLFKYTNIKCWKKNRISCMDIAKISNMIAYFKKVNFCDNKGTESKSPQQIDTIQNCVDMVYTRILSIINKMKYNILLCAFVYTASILLIILIVCTLQHTFIQTDRVESRKTCHTPSVIVTMPMHEVHHPVHLFTTDAFLLFWHVWTMSTRAPVIIL